MEKDQDGKSLRPQRNEAEMLREAIRLLRAAIHDSELYLRKIESVETESRY